MVSTALTIGLLIAILVNAIVILINIWIAYRIRKQYLRLKDPVYVKTLMESKTWMGRSVTPKLVKKMSISTLIGAFVFGAIAFYILFSMGPNPMWAAFLAFGIIMAYGTYAWMNYTKTQEKTVINASTIQTSSKLSRLLIIPIILLIILGYSFKNWMMSSPVFQIWIIGFAVFVIFSSEISKRKAMLK